MIKGMVKELITSPGSCEENKEVRIAQSPFSRGVEKMEGWEHLFV